LVPDADPDPDAGLDRLLGHLLGRLRGFSARTWAAGDRRGAVRRLADDLVALGEPGHELPDLPDYAYADVVAVLAREAMQQGRRDEVAAALLTAWNETR
jgi:hypothetical protein